MALMRRMALIVTLPPWTACRWNPPTPQSRVAVVDSRLNFYRMGMAQTSNELIHSKASLITSRKA